MKKVINILLIIAVLISVSSCMKELSGPDNPASGKGETEIFLRVHTSDNSTGRSTRSLTFVQENAINNIYVLAFKGNTLMAIQEGRNVNSTPGHTNPAYSGSGEFTVSLTASAGTADTYHLVILANAKDILEATLGTNIANATHSNYDSVVAAIWSEINGKMFETNKAIPMWSEIKNIAVLENTPRQNVTLLRSVARVDIGVGTVRQMTGTDRTNFEWDGKDTNVFGEGDVIPFELTSAIIMRPNNRYAVIPATVDTPTVPAGFTAFTPTVSALLFKYSATPTAQGGFIQRDIYIPEANVIMGGADANHTDRMALVIGGKYNGSSTETFYRLDFKNGENLINVLRNTLYQFNISRVSGPGVRTPEEAYNSRTMNMNINIEEWDVTDMGEIFIDGPFRIMLQNSRNENRADRMAVVYRGVGSNDRIRFETSNNIKNADLILELDNGGGAPSNLTAQNDRFKVEVKEENGVRWFEFTALKPFDKDAPDNPSKLTGTVPDSRIKFEITILQKDADPNDWNNGGNFPLDW
jgi:hypothetical protein